LCIFYLKKQHYFMEKKSDKATIVIPARYGSTRFPGKPLVDLKGKTLLQRVVGVAEQAALLAQNTDVLVATDDQRILSHAASMGVRAVMTPVDCLTGTDRAYHALLALPENERSGIVINLQGDAPMTSPKMVAALIDTLRTHEEVDAATSAIQLSWPHLDQLRQSKQTTPFSGTTVVMKANGQALWFSKHILPAIRKEDRSTALSPVYKHIGLYGYRWEFLKVFIGLPEGHYERLEGLEQLRILEHGYALQVVVGNGDGCDVGVDTLEDAERVRALL
jgi:3-deoxy-manno-octulosonate cytidylyltransferase (CMP-KDO synthetase)